MTSPSSPTQPEHGANPSAPGARKAPASAARSTAVVVGGNRIPFAKANGAYAHASSHDLLTAALDGLVARFGLAGQTLGEVAGGAVLKHTRDFNLTREAVLSSALAPQTPAVDLGQACGTSLETVVYIANKITLGQLDVGIAGGADSASDAPIAVSEPLRRALLAANAARTLPARLKAFSSLRPGHFAPSTPQVVEPRTGLSMGEHQALTTARWGISREAQDELAAASHHNLARAWEEGFFDDLVTPYLGLTRDAPLRPDTSVEKLAALKPVFGLSGSVPATMTAGNSTPLSDGAAVVLLADADYAAAHHLPMLAKVVDAEVAAVDYPGGDDLLLAPVAAVGRLLARQRLGLADFDLYEVHEAFAATVLATLAAWESDEYCRHIGLAGALGPIDRTKLNVTGSSLAAGHPFAATGARIVPTLATLLAAKGPGARGLISICAAGGQGVAAILEAI
ncbi:MAG: acetyl-CoA C-acetyltransferase [Propionicimonas sp.]|uniref:acetyl-CoA C-acetyltransferase n=1 Tax=Propionicimonas sp. TaxID=1955623 RepID=UPI002B20D09D|nr:acetyl-CoA C-acetyltransferase [Propionicimonas sp.]MEA4943453.1 acetyl-CoA C-acetyltransferase [Propionicimonas sp.]MEA5054629.1 acetyl-CoA C-acetyltransferase [Propionicimonas sp.]MEA5117652.1 acetyl-CoA C-acetyltransferase [Propionicimonas sp.]